jgi:SMC interacting uncharacterized protein involved in chromosome segregation
MALAAYPVKHGKKCYCKTPSLSGEYGCSSDRLFETEIVATVLAALQHQISVAYDADKNDVKIKSKSHKPNPDRLIREIETIQSAIEKYKTAKMNLWEKYHSKEISTESFRSENEKIDSHIKQCNEKIGKLLADAADYETAKVEENVFVQQFSRHIGLKELSNEVIEDLIEEIRFYSAERIEIIFKFADEYDIMKANV